MREMAEMERERVSRREIATWIQRNKKRVSKTEMQRQDHLETETEIMTETETETDRNRETDIWSLRQRERQEKKSKAGEEQKESQGQSVLFPEGRTKFEGAHQISSRTGTLPDPNLNVLQTSPPWGSVYRDESPYRLGVSEASWSWGFMKR